MSRPKEPFTRSRRKRLLGGVCAGVSRRYGWPLWRVRLAWAVVAAIPILPGLPAYLLLWLLTPLTEG